MMLQQKFDMMIGELDRILSELILASKEACAESNRQTLKHHVEDMAGAAKKILNNLSEKPATGWDAIPDARPRHVVWLGGVPFSQTAFQHVVEKITEKQLKEAREFMKQSERQTFPLEEYFAKLRACTTPLQTAKVVLEEANRWLTEEAALKKEAEFTMPKAHPIPRYGETQAEYVARAETATAMGQGNTSFNPMRLSNGLYRLFFSNGQQVLAAVGRNAGGNVWFAPTNWTSGPSYDWTKVVAGRSVMTEIPVHYVSMDGEYLTLLVEDQAVKLPAVFCPPVNVDLPPEPVATIRATIASMRERIAKDGTLIESLGGQLKQLRQQYAESCEQLESKREEVNRLHVALAAHQELVQGASSRSQRISVLEEALAKARREACGLERVLTAERATSSKLREDLLAILG